MDITLRVIVTGPPNALIWLSHSWKTNFSTSVKINYNYLAKMNGEDQMNKRMSPVMDSKNIGHQKVNLSFGLNYINSNEFQKIID